MSVGASSSSATQIQYPDTNAHLPPTTSLSPSADSPSTAGFSHNKTSPLSVCKSPRDQDQDFRPTALSPEPSSGGATQTSLSHARRHSFDVTAGPESSTGRSSHSDLSSRARDRKEEEVLKALGTFIGLKDLEAWKEKNKYKASPVRNGEKKMSRKRDFLGLDFFGSSSPKSSSSSNISASRPSTGNKRPTPTTHSDLPPLHQPTPTYPVLPAAMAVGPTNITNVTRDEEDMCPVCLEALAMRLRAEKPHVTPVCGHRLHAGCFEAVYGSVAKAKQQGTSLGLCGVCRRDMRIAEDGERQLGKMGKNKFAAMAGIPGRDNGPSTLDSHKVRSISRRTLAMDVNGGQSLHDPTEDDDVVGDDSFSPTHEALRHRASADTLQGMASPQPGRSSSTSPIVGIRGRHSGPGSRHDQDLPVAQPKITITAEHSTLTRSANRDQKQNVTCMVTVKMPTRCPSQIQHQFQPHHQFPHTLHGGDQSILSPSMYSPQGSDGMNGRQSLQSPHHDHFQYLQHGHQMPTWPSVSTHPSRMTTMDRSPPMDGPPQHQNRPASPTDSSGKSSHGTDPVNVQHGPLQSMVDDLRARMHDWKGHDPDTFGVLKLFNILSVRKSDQSREFLLYLFEETLLCVDENKRPSPAGGGDAKPLRLRGRVYVRHISRVEETSSSPSDLCLTVEMAQKDLDAFVISFKERSVLEVWKDKIQQLVDRQKTLVPSTATLDDTRSVPRGSVNSGMTQYTRDTNSSSEGGHSTAFTAHTRTTMSTAPPLSSVGEEDETPYGLSKLATQPMAMSRDLYQHHSPTISLGSFGALHEVTAIDLMLIMSVPVQSHAAPSSYSLKIRLIRQALDFIISTIGPRARVSVVTYSVGEGSRCQLRKTPFLAVGKEEGRRRLQTVVEEIGTGGSRFDEGNLGMVDHAEDKVSVVSAVNLALDIVLQRKQKSSLSGILLVNDARDCSSKPQMSLVMARAEAANIPIHTLGWGKGHDPSSLWQLSHHTGGTYTFVPDWYSLKDCIAGMIGGMLSVAVTNFRLHISVPERRWFRIRKIAGTHSVILAADGKNADIDLAELRYGEQRELLVEMEMTPMTKPQEMEQRLPPVSTATDEFFLCKTGLNPLSLDDYDGNFYDNEFDELVDEVPLFEVDASYRDPAAAKNVSRLPYPILLTITVMPPPVGTRSRSLSPDPAIVRRRIEILTSDALTRALLLLSRNSEPQARRLLSETRRIINALASNMAGTGSSDHEEYGCPRRPSAVLRVAQSVLAACAEDIDSVLQGMQDRATFDQLGRNFAAQQAVVLREQRAWTDRSATERAFWTADDSIWFAAQSARFVGSQ